MAFFGLEEEALIALGLSAYVTVCFQVSPTTPRVYNNDSFETWQDGNLDLNASTSASGPKRHGRARRATVSVMEAPIATKKPPPAKTPTDDLVPMHWESQTSVSPQPLLNSKRYRFQLTERTLAQRLLPRWRPLPAASKAQRLASSALSALRVSKRPKRLKKNQPSVKVDIPVFVGSFYSSLQPEGARR